MAQIFNAVKVLTSTTGTGAVTAGAAVSDAFCTPAEAGVTDGAVSTWLLEEGDDFQLFRGTYTASGATVSRDTTLLSKIGGTAGTSNMNLGGTAVLSIVAAAEDIKGAASTSAAGIVELATDAEAIAKSSTTVALTPSNLAAMAAFSAHKNGTDQTGAAPATYVKVTATTEVFDRGSYYDSTNSKWVPPSGPVLIVCRVQATTNILSTSIIYAGIYKNGSLLKQNPMPALAGGAGASFFSVVDQADGDDEYEFYVYVDTTNGSANYTIDGAAASTWWGGSSL